MARKRHAIVAIMAILLKLAIMSLVNMTTNMENIGVLCEEQDKCGLPAKAELKNINGFESYVQNKIFYEKLAKNGQFRLYFVPKFKMLKNCSR